MPPRRSRSIRTPIPRSLLPIVIVLCATAAGCIELPEDSATGAGSRPDSARGGGMSAQESRQDSAIPCPDGGDPIDLPRACAQRVLDVTGRIGVDQLPLELAATNGMLSIEPSGEGEEWSMRVVYAVEARDEAGARDALDTAWTWSHQDADGRHALRAGPTPTTGITVVVPLEPRVIMAETRLQLPAWLVLEAKLRAENGGVSLHGFDVASLDVETQNGQVLLSGTVGDLRVHTDNGAITGSLTPRASAGWELGTDNGQIVLRLPEGRRFGYDIDATTENGQVVIRLQDGDLRRHEGGATFRSRDFAERAAQVSLLASTGNGQIALG